MLPSIALLSVCLAAGPAQAGDFESLEGPRLIDLAAGDQAKPHSALSIDELIALPRVLTDSRSTLIVVRTDQGNLARLLVSPALRKSRDPKAAPQPVLLVDRFDTFELPGATNRLATGRELILFDGFRLDLDIGQVVPDDQGGDIQFRRDDKRGRLEAMEKASLLTFDRLPAAAGAPTGGPSAGRIVRAGDFAGTYQLVANGQWSGRLELAVDADRHVAGRFRSDQTGSSYRVVGEAGKDEPARIELTIQFPRSQMNIQGWMWTEGKSAFSGEARLLEHTYGFVAVRAGKSIDGEAGGTRVSVERAPADAPLRVTIGPDGVWQIEGVNTDEAAMGDALRKALAQSATPELSIAADASASFARVHDLIRLANELGPFEIRLTTSDRQTEAEK